MGWVPSVKVHISGSGHYAEISMAGDYTHEGFESPAKNSGASIIEYWQEGLITHLLFEIDSTTDV